MTTYTLLAGQGGLEATGPATDIDDSNGYTMGLQFRLNAAGGPFLTGRVLAIHFYRNAIRSDSIPFPSDPPTRAGVFDADSKALIIPGENFTDPGIVTGWIDHIFATPVEIDSGHIYRAAVFYPVTGNHHYSAFPQYWTPGSGNPGQAGLTLGPVHLDNDDEAAGGDGGQCSFFPGGSDLTYPDGAFNRSNYFIGITVEVDDPVLLAAYSFDEGSGTSLIDHSGNSHDVPLPATGPPHWDASGHTSSGISDDGTSGTGDACGLDEADWSTWLPVGEAITTMCWAKLHTDTNAIIMSLGVDSGFSGNFCMYYLSGTGMGIYMSVGGSTYNATDSGFVPDDTWHHWAATCDGVSLRLYRDGVQVAITNPPGYPEFADTANFMIGLAYPTFNSIGMDGILDDVRIYKGALSVGQINTCKGVDVGSEPDPLISDTPTEFTGATDSTVTATASVGATQTRAAAASSQITALAAIAPVQTRAAVAGAGVTVTSQASGTHIRHAAVAATVTAQASPVATRIKAAATSATVTASSSVAATRAAAVNSSVTVTGNIAPSRTRIAAVVASVTESLQVAGNVIRSIAVQAIVTARAVIISSSAPTGDTIKVWNGTEWTEAQIHYRQDGEWT